MARSNFNKDTDAMDAFIRGIGGIVLLLTIVLLSSLFIFSVSDIVYCKNGIVVATNAQYVVNAPAEGVVTGVKVALGDTVSKGDTLLILQNEDLIDAHQNLQRRISVLEQKNKYTNQSIYQSQSYLNMLKGHLAYDTLANSTVLIQIDNVHQRLYTYTENMLNNIETLDKLKSDLNRYEIMQKSLYVIAPQSGIISNMRDLGLTSFRVQKDEQLVAIVSTNARNYVKLVLPHRKLASVKAGQNVLVDIPAFVNNTVISGRVCFVTNNPADHAFYALVELKNPPIGLKQDYIASARIIIQKIKLYRLLTEKMLSTSG